MTWRTQPMASAACSSAAKRLVICLGCAVKPREPGGDGVFAEVSFPVHRTIAIEPPFRSLWRYGVIDLTPDGGAKAILRFLTDSKWP